MRVLRVSLTAPSQLVMSVALLAVFATGCGNAPTQATPSGSTTATITVPDDQNSAAGSDDAGERDPASSASETSDSTGTDEAGEVLAIASGGSTSSAAAGDPPASGDGTPQATDWPNFRNGTDLRGIAGTTLPDKLELLWEIPTHDGVTSTAAIAGGRIYVAELSGNIRCLDLHTGQEYWHYRTIESEDPKEFAPGFNAPVTLSETAVFIGDEDGAFHALDRASGAELWPPLETNAEIKGGATVLPPDPQTGAPRVMFGSHDGKLYCLNAGTGEQIWAFDTMGPVNGSQAIDGKYTFVSGCDRPFLQVVDVETGEQHAEIPLDDSLMIASPALRGSVLYFGTPDGDTIALDWQAAARQWTYADPKRQQEIHSSPAVTEQLVLIGSRDKRLHAINRQTGEAEWTFETRGPVDSSPVVVGDRIFFGSADRNVYGINLRGEELWKHNTGHRVSASPAVGEGHLVIGCEGPGGPILCFGSMR